MELLKVSMEELVPVLQLQMESGGLAPLRVTGSSMHPTLRNYRDQVLLKKITQRPKRPQVILYRRDDGNYILHRIVRDRSDGWICCGDNQWQPEFVRFDQAVAVVEAIVRKDKTYYVNQQGHGFFVWLWNAVFPLRRPILAVRRRLGRLRRNIRRKQK